MPRILLVGNWAECNGWGYQQISHILALDSVGVEVIPRRIRITGAENKEIPPRILEMEKRDDRNPDLILLNTLPGMYERYGSAKHLGFYVCESSNFKATGWQHKINIMDAAINCCYANKLASRESGVKIPIHIVPQAIDINKFSTPKEPHDVRKNCPGDFIFYTIGEISRRKNLECILKAFHTEFAPNEAVQLFIKTTPANMGNEAPKVIDQLINNVKSGLKLYKDNTSYKRELVSCEISSEESLIRLHQSADCFVSASHSEAFSIPAAEALAAGKLVIAPGYGGFTEYLNEKNSYVVNGVEDYSFGALDTLPDLYTSNEMWFNPSVKSMRECMRSAFSKRDLNKRKLEQARKDVRKLSFESVGLVYKKVLESI